jgi:hypothetical protein
MTTSIDQSIYMHVVVLLLLSSYHFWPCLSILKINRPLSLSVEWDQIKVGGEHVIIIIK